MKRKKPDKFLNELQALFSAEAERKQKRTRKSKGDPILDELQALFQAEEIKKIQRKVKKRIDVFISKPVSKKKLKPLIKKIKREKVKKKIEKKSRENLFPVYNEHIPHFLLAENIASSDSDETFLLFYEDGKKLEINLRLQFEGDTYTNNFIVRSVDSLNSYLMDVLREIRPKCSLEMKRLKERGVEVSFLLFNATSYNNGTSDEAPTKFIEVVYP